ncbi:hypothetical protein CDAR_202151 [Caerostris darwini]|uniref:Uncharacterized protein n=1 Tax=Caerostris darwini TaxID=1538125 RepID=A0AAV4RMM0_9ARAC|nr:hypothetical protein CDAR_202151 [Caerostris darwini]
MERKGRYDTTDAARQQQAHKNLSSAVSSCFRPSKSAHNVRTDAPSHGTVCLSLSMTVIASIRLCVCVCVFFCCGRGWSCLLVTERNSQKGDGEEETTVEQLGLIRLTHNHL